jgi:hypothetical protein
MLRRIYRHLCCIGTHRALWSQEIDTWNEYRYVYRLSCRPRETPHLQRRYVYTLRPLFFIGIVKNPFQPAYIVTLVLESSEPPFHLVYYYHSFFSYWNRKNPFHLLSVLAIKPRSGAASSSLIKSV